MTQSLYAMAYPVWPIKVPSFPIELAPFAVSVPHDFRLTVFAETLLPDQSSCAGAMYF